MQYVIYFLIAIGATTVGSLTGMGGGVIIKPLMDVLHGFDVQTIGVLSSLTVFSMSVVSIGKQMLAKTKIPFGTAIPLALGSVVGGLVGGEAAPGHRGRPPGQLRRDGGAECGALPADSGGVPLYEEQEPYSQQAPERRGGLPAGGRLPGRLLLLPGDRRRPHQRGPSLSTCSPSTPSRPRCAPW